MQVEGLGVVYTGRERTEALRDVRLEVGEGEFVAVVGASGCGKTTLLRLVAGLLEPTVGAVRVFGEPPVRQCEAGRIGFVFQKPVLLPWRDLHSNVALPLRRKGVGPQENAERAAEALRAVGMEDFTRRYPHQISGGMQQRVSLARAMVHAPSLVLLDEPFGALDEMGRVEMGELVMRLHAQRRFTAVLVTHSIHEAVNLADRVLVLGPRPGTVIADVAVDQLPRPRPRRVLDDPVFHSYVACLRAILSDGRT